MKFKIGDRVKFLDEHGGGIISRIVSHNLVHVAIEDGFEIPTLVNNLILSQDIEKSLLRSGQDNRAQEAAPVPPPEEEPARDEPLPKLWGRREMPEGVYLAWVPVDQKWLVTGNYELFLINHGPWDVIFSLYLRNDEGVYESRDYDVVPAASRIHLATVKPERLERWADGSVQLIFRKDRTDRLLMPASIDFHIRGHRFLKEGAYQEYSFFEGKIFLVSLMSLSSAGTAGKPSQKDEPARDTLKARQDEEEELIHAYRKGEREAVVDLHVEALMEDYGEFGTRDLLNIQLGHFLACLESAIRCKYRKVTFIHGVGAGKLRQEIEFRLKEYQRLGWEDAPMRDYGQGAVLVRLFQGEP
jgi:hypothetical protein